MSANLAVFMLTMMLLGFVGAHSLWRFWIRKQLPSLVNAATAFLCIVYAGGSFQSNMLQPLPVEMGYVTLIVGIVGAFLIIKHELGQEHPWN
jgi:hypothetical protein